MLKSNGQIQIRHDFANFFGAAARSSINQQFDKAAIPETAKVLQAGVDDMTTAGVEFRKIPGTISNEARGFLDALESIR
jgi:hypothetical protein